MTEINLICTENHPATPSEAWEENSRRSENWNRDYFHPLSVETIQSDGSSVIVCHICNQSVVYNMD